MNNLGGNSLPNIVQELDIHVYAVSVGHGHLCRSSVAGGIHARWQDADRRVDLPRRAGSEDSDRIQDRALISLSRRLTLALS